jgi:hypothetical protein
VLEPHLTALFAHTMARSTTAPKFPLLVPLLPLFRPAVPPHPPLPALQVFLPPLFAPAPMVKLSTDMLSVARPTQTSAHTQVQTLSTLTSTVCLPVTPQPPPAVLHSLTLEATTVLDQAHVI